MALREMRNKTTTTTAADKCCSSGGGGKRKRRQLLIEPAEALAPSFPVESDDNNFISSSSSGNDKSYHHYTSNASSSSGGNECESRDTSGATSRCNLPTSRGWHNNARLRVASNVNSGDKEQTPQMSNRENLSEATECNRNSFLFDKYNLFNRLSASKSKSKCQSKSTSFGKSVNGQSGKRFDEHEDHRFKSSNSFNVITATTTTTTSQSNQSNHFDLSDTTSLVSQQQRLDSGQMATMRPPLSESASACDNHNSNSNNNNHNHYNLNLNHNRNHDHNQNHNDQHNQNRKQQQQQQFQGKSRRKSELTSFLTILFGCSLVFALFAMNLNICRGESPSSTGSLLSRPIGAGGALNPTSVLRNSTLNSEQLIGAGSLRPNSSRATSGVFVATTVVSAANSSTPTVRGSGGDSPLKVTASNSTNIAPKPPATPNGEANESERDIETSKSVSEDGDSAPVPAVDSSSGGTSGDKDDDSNDSSDNNDDDDDGRKLRELIVDAASSGADLIVNHLKGNGGGGADGELESSKPASLNETTTSTELIAETDDNSRDETLRSDDNGDDNDSQLRTIATTIAEAAAATAATTNTSSPLKVSTSFDNNNNNDRKVFKTSGAAGQQLKLTAASGRSVGGAVNDANGYTERSYGPDDLENKFAMDTYAKWRSAGNDIIELFSRKLLPVIMEHGYDVDTSTVSGLLQIFNGIRGLKPWAMKLLDASARLSPGVLVGTQSDFGDFDECLGIRVDDPSGFAASNAEYPVEVDEQTGLKSTTLVGRYCIADVEFPKPKRSVRQRVVAAPASAPANLSSSRSSSGANYINNAAATTTTADVDDDASKIVEYLPIELRRSLLNFSETSDYKDTIFAETGNFFHMLYVDPIRVGICMTNKVDPNSLEQVVNKLLEEFAITISFKSRCVTKYDKPQWTVYQHYSAYILLIVCSLVCLSTILDLLQLKLNKLPCSKRHQPARAKLDLVAQRYRPLYTSFSLLRNTKRLFKPQQCKEVCSSSSSSSPHSPVPLSQVPAVYKNLSRQALQQAKVNQFNVNSITSPFNHIGQKHSNGSISSAPSLATTTSSIPDSSVESSPSIERRQSKQQATGQQQLTSNSSLSSSSMELILNEVRPTKSDIESSRQSYSTAAAAAAESNFYSTTTMVSSCGKIVGDSGEPGGDISLRCLHGIRVITMIWMIVNHTYMFGGFFVLWAHRRLIDIAEWPKSLSFQIVLNGWLTVETYFFLSALIIVLNVMPLLKRSKFNYFTYVIHRLLRLLPAYIGLVCLNFLWPLISSGPVWLVKGKSFTQTPCENYLWTNFLFINNWIWPEKQCMVHTWFLSADFQLYILAPIIVYLLYRRPALGHSVNLLVALLASILSGFVIYTNKLLPTTLINKLEFDAIKVQLSYSYFATYQHVGPYCLGILTGYLLYKRPHVRLPKYLTWLLWLLLPPLSFTTLLLTYLWNGAYDDPALINPSPLVSAFYVAIHRTIWTALVAWLVFACSSGRAKLLAQFLSHSIFIPISRLSYSIYLVHFPIIMFRALNIRHTKEWTDHNFIWEACGNFVASIFMAYFLNIAFESPIINLENYISGRDRPHSASEDKRLHHQHHQQQQQQQQHQQRFQFGDVAGLGCNSLQKVVDGKAMTRSEYSNGGDRSGPNGSVGETSSSHSTEATNSFERSTKDSPRSSASSSSSTASGMSSSLLNGVQQIGGAGHRMVKTTATSTSTSSSPRSKPLSKDDQSSSLLAGQKNQAALRSYRKSQNPSQQQQQQQQSDLSSNSRTMLSDRDATITTTNMMNDQTDNSMVRKHDRINRLTRSKFSDNGQDDDVDDDENDYGHQLYPFDSKNGRDDVYNIASEYRHYAPGGYQQWRMYNQGNGAGASGGSRPIQYATLARTSRLTQQDRPFEQQNQMQQQHYLHRNRPLVASSRRLGQLGYHAHHNYPMSEQQLAYATMASAAKSRASFRHAPASVDIYGRQAAMPLNVGNNLTRLDDDSDQHRLAARMSRHRRQARYNTLTATGSRDLRSQYSHQTGSDLGGTTRWHQQDWTNQVVVAGDDDGLSAAPGGGGGRGSSASWLQQGAMIPRVDSSTLRRQARWQADQNAASSIVEEQVEHDNDGEGEGQGGVNKEISAL